MLVAQVLTADGLMMDEEKAFLRRAMERLQLTPEEQEQVISLEGWDEAEPIVAGLEPAKKRAIVDELVEATLIDGKLSPHELATVKRITEALEI
jgi:uncharacterized tellurite resistance protein B-like protein